MISRKPDGLVSDPLPPPEAPQDDGFASPTPARKWCATRVRICYALVVLCALLLLSFLFDAAYVGIGHGARFAVRPPDYSSPSPPPPQRLDSPLYYTEYVNRVRFPHTKRRLPQCIIVGVRKCGTRALLEFMNLHPRVVKATQEVHFFDDDSKYSLGLEWYRRRMPYSFADQVTVEKSPSYFVTEHVPQRIYAMNPGARLVVIVRDPVTRAVSDYTQIHANKIARSGNVTGWAASASFEATALSADGRVNADYKALRISVYADYARAWLETFPRAQIHVVDGDRLVDEPLHELRAIETFLGLEPRVRPDNFYFNETKGFYCLRTESTDKCLGEAKGRRHPRVDPTVVRLLRRYFAPHNRRFFDMIGQNFSWPDE